MTSAADATPPQNAPGRLLRLSWGRTVVEFRQFVRVPEQVFFTFLLPILFLLIFGTVFSGEIEGPDGRSIPFVQYFIPGIIASGVASSTFANLAVAISTEQHGGLLKRLAGTPLPKAAYVLGKLASATAITIVQTALMLVLGVVVFGIDLPADAGRWATFVVVLVLAAATGAALGLAYTRAIRNATAAAAMVQAPFLVLQFISGVFFRWDDLPGWLQVIASIFPLRWAAEGLRYAFIPDWLGQAEYPDTWGWEWPVTVLVAWLAIAFVLAIVCFRWTRQSDR